MEDNVQTDPRKAKNELGWTATNPPHHLVAEADFNRLKSASTFRSGSMRVLVTGAHGFMGGYVVEALRHSCNEAVILAYGKTGDPALDVTDAAAVRRTIKEQQPT